MPSITINSPTKLGPTVKRWNSIMLVPDHRRSQSLSAPHTSTQIEALRSTTSLVSFRPRDDEQLSIRSGNTAAIVEKEDDNVNNPRMLSISPARSNYSRHFPNASPSPSRPTPAPRLWEDAESSVNSSLKGLETTMSPNHILAASIHHSLQTEILPAATFSVAESPRSPNPMVSKFSTWKEKSFAGRRKGSVPELELGSDKTSKPFNPDSPTLPTIYSARTESTIMTQGTITPRLFTHDSILSEHMNHTALRTPEWQERDQKRASSMLLPSSLAPVVIPPAPSRIPPVPPIDTSMSQRQMEEDRPPRPPPKSPRTLLRAFPIPKSAVMPGRHTANSSIDSISPLDTPMTTITAWSPVSTYSASTVHSPDTLGRSPVKYGPVTFEQPPQTVSFGPSGRMSNLKHGRSTSNTQYDQRIPRKPSPQALGNHSRMASDTSVMNRGRPTKRGQSAMDGRASPASARGQKVASPDPQFSELPRGIRKSQTGHIPVDELYGLRRDAEDRASDCNILTQKQIAALDQEQRLLDESCNQFHNTISGLEEARRAIYNNLKSYLEGPCLTQSARDHVMKQTQTLHGLDLQIDEWQNRLNMATDRKMAIQSRVWEHLTAILTAASLAAEVGRPEEQTPPTSPERVIRHSITQDPFEEDAILNDLASSPRNDIESITVFADSGVASLLRSIEEELDVIDQSRYYNNLGEEEIMI